MIVKCEDDHLSIVPEDAQDRAYLEAAMTDDRIVLVRSSKPRGFVDGPEFVMVSEQQKEVERE